MCWGSLEGAGLGVEGQWELEPADVGGEDEAEGAVGAAGGADGLEVGPVQLEVDLLLALVLDQPRQRLWGLRQQVVPGSLQVLVWKISLHMLMYQNKLLVHVADHVVFL